MSQIATTYAQALYDLAKEENITETVTGVLSAVPVFELACTPDETAVTALEGVLRL
jgi:hypothetical protein